MPMPTETLAMSAVDAAVHHTLENLNAVLPPNKSMMLVIFINEYMNDPRTMTLGARQEAWAKLIAQVQEQANEYDRKFPCRSTL